MPWWVNANSQQAQVIRNNVEGRKEGWMDACWLELNGWMKWVCATSEGKQWWTMEASREMGDASSEPPYCCCCCCWREIFLFSTSCLPALLFCLGFPLSHLFCLCSVLPSLFCLVSFHLSYCFPPLFSSCSSCINNLSCEFPYLPYIAPVDLLSLIPSLTRIGSCASNRTLPNPVLLKINFYLP